jgi:hypothetical protein
MQTYNSKLPAELELYIGAPVILKVSQAQLARLSIYLTVFGDDADNLIA